jgi:hypothetical protein
MKTDLSTLPLVARLGLAKWKEMIEKRVFEDLPMIISIDAVFHSPVSLKPYRGRDLVCLVLRTAAHVFEDFRYERCVSDNENALLEFSAHIGDVQLKGIHAIRFDADGLICDVEKFIRPSKAAILLGDTIGERAGEEIRALRDQ